MPLAKLRRMSILSEIARMRFTVSNDSVSEIDRLSAKLVRAVARLEEMYEE